MNVAPSYIELVLNHLAKYTTDIVKKNSLGQVILDRLATLI